jgi:hypothetical protein
VSAYLAADVMIKGLQVAGKNPTRASFIKNLTQVTNYTAGGLLPGPVNFNHFGTAEKTLCSFFVHVQGQGFVAANNGNAFCGTLPPGL